MRSIFFVFALLLTGLAGLNAQGLKVIKLDAPDKTRGTAVMKALADRHSERAFTNKPLSHKDLSDLLWAANGINRPDGKRTAASAMNKQDVDVYVILPEGAYLYDAAASELKPVAAGDHRGLIAGGQAFVKQAPLCLLIVSDYARFGNGDTEKSKLFGAFDAGLVSQNVAIFCSACGLATVPRASMDSESLRKVLRLSATQLPVINHPVGYPK